MEPLTASGLGSGLDIRALVDQLVAAERQAPNDRINLAEARANREISSIGKLKGALSEFRDVVDRLSDFDQFAQRQSAVAEDELLAVQAGGSAVPSSYNIEILARTSRQKIASQEFVDGNAAVGYGTLTLTVGSDVVAVEIDESLNTLVDIRDAINAAENNPGVIASIINADDGTRLVLTGADSGLESAFSISSSDGDGGLAVLDYSIGTPGTYTEIQAASDASLRVDGFEITSSSNSVTGAIEDVTLDLLAAEPGNVFTLEIEYNEQASRDLITNFVGAYNALAGVIRKETEFDVENGLRGALLGDSLTRSIQDTIRRELSAVVDDSSLAFNTLAEIGIVTTTSGNLEIENDRLNDAIALDFDAIGRLFSNDNGLAASILERADVYLDTDGQIESREGRLKGRLDDLSESRDRLDLRLESVRRRFEIQFNAMDLFVSQLNTTSQFLAQQLG